MGDIGELELTWFERLFILPLTVTMGACGVYAMLGWIPILVFKAVEKPYEFFVGMEKWSVIVGVAAMVLLVVGCIVYTWIENKTRHGSKKDE